MAPRALRRLQLYTRGGATYRRYGFLIDEIENPRSKHNPSHLRVDGKMATLHVKFYLQLWSHSEGIAAILRVTHIKK